MPADAGDADHRSFSRPLGITRFRFGCKFCVYDRWSPWTCCGSRGVATFSNCRIRIAVSETDLADLRSRLTNTRWPEPETVQDWSQGVPIKYLRELVDYWIHDYDWREREARLNRFDHFTTEIDGLGIHFIHQRSPRSDALPLLVTHGWPGSVVEFQKIIAPLTDPAQYGGSTDDAFHVVCPSLPGHGFSDRPSARGWGVEKIAQVWESLMSRLGYERYGAQGGDWGAPISSVIGQRARSCVGIHLSQPMGRRPAGDPTAETEDEKRSLASIERLQRSGSGYMHQQATRPQTLGYGLVDSPVGQLAWILEKFWAWSDHNGSVRRLPS